MRDGRSEGERNPDVSRVLVQPRRPSFADSLRFLASIFRRYDLAISTSTTDRSFINLWFAAPRRIGKIASPGFKTWWKRKIVRAALLVDPDTHVLVENLRFADLLGIERHYPWESPQSALAPAANNSAVEQLSEPYAVVHLMPGSVLRQWPDEHWRSVIDALRNRGIAVVATGSGDPAEVAYVDKILTGCSGGEELAPLSSLAGELQFNELAALIQRAVLFIGPDTSVSHMAATTGVPVVALFGPTDVARWGPWPSKWPSEPGRDNSPWQRDLLEQTQGNVSILRMACDCGSRTPDCRLTPSTRASCMTRLAPERVLEAVGRLLQRPETSCVLAEVATKEPEKAAMPLELLSGNRPAGRKPVQSW
ncbi:MAG TPA: glycosyltransferase family 9 protein [Woeseiaceae bacterium]|nr:glycosyltransferase family 9 protein [Woeseiaceae bacterium]